MIDKQAIDAALLAHAQWKQRLLDAIEKGTSEFKTENVKRDNVCPFGQWLYALSSEDQHSENFKKVKQLHTEFHAMASRILELATSGKKEEAKQAMEFGHEYTNASGKLILALNEWKNSI